MSETSQITAILEGWARDGFGHWSFDRRGESYELVNLDNGVCQNACEGGDVQSLLDFAQKVDERVRKQGAATAGGFNSPSTTKSRGRPLNPVVARRRDRVAEMAKQFSPATVRQIYYLAETEGLVDKTENDYRKIQHDLLLLRQQRHVLYSWISDNTRWQRKSRSYRGIDHFLNLTIKTYRRDLWATGDVHVEVWVEKDALAGVIMEETDPFDVPLLVARGCSSETYLYEAAQTIDELQKTTYIYHFGDYDPTGLVSAKHIERKLRDFAPNTEIYFERVAVTPEQIRSWNLPTRPTKRDNNRHAKNFVGDSCELDAIPPLKLRELVRERMERHLNQRKYDVLKAAEKSERDTLLMFARDWRAAE